MSGPVWGNPWHGKVRNNFLALPGGGTRFLAQPFPSSSGATDSDRLQESYGRTLRIALPGVPPVERSPAELAADIAAGYRWQHTAVLSGGRAQLSGKIMDGWIYQDPAGSRWRVRCAQITDTANFNTTAPVSLTFTLARFGDFGQPAEQYSYSVSLTNWGLNYPNVNPASVKLVVDDVRADGSAAVLMVHQRQASAFNLDERRAYSFQELTISGSGHEAVLEISLVFSNAEVLTATLSAPPLQQFVGGYYQLRDTEGDVVIPWEWRVWEGVYGDPGLPPGAGSHTVGLESFDTRECTAQQGTGVVEAARIVSMWYTALGVLEPVVLRAAETFTVDAPPPSAEREYSLTTNWQYSVEFDGMPTAAITGALSLAGEQVFVRAETEAFTEISTWEADGYDGSSVLTGDEFNNSLRTIRYSPELDHRFLYATTGAIRRRGIGLSLPGLPADELARYANHAIGPIISRVSINYGMHPPMTPSGQATGAVREVATQSGLVNYRYGSWDPHTQDTTWGDTAPVCYV